MTEKKEKKPTISVGKRKKWEFLRDFDTVCRLNFAKSCLAFDFRRLDNSLLHLNQLVDSLDAALHSPDDDAALEISRYGCAFYRERAQMDLKHFNMSMADWRRLCRSLGLDPLGERLNSRYFEIEDGTDDYVRELLGGNDHSGEQEPEKDQGKILAIAVKAFAKQKFMTAQGEEIAEKDAREEISRIIGCPAAASAPFFAHGFKYVCWHDPDVEHKANRCDPTALIPAEEPGGKPRLVFGKVVFERSDPQGKHKGIDLEGISFIKDQLIKDRAKIEALLEEQ